MNRILLSLAALGLAGSIAVAQQTFNFAELDTDGNGELSYNELLVAWPDFTEAEFSSADTDGSGGLSLIELEALQGGAAPAEGVQTLPAPSFEDPPQTLSPPSSDD